MNLTIEIRFPAEARISVITTAVTKPAESVAMITSLHTVLRLRMRGAEPPSLLMVSHITQNNKLLRNQYGSIEWEVLKWHVIHYLLMSLFRLLSS